VPDSDVTLGEVYRRLTHVETSFNQSMNRLGDRIDRLEFVHRDVYVADQAALHARIAELEDDKKWTRRALFGSLLLPVVVGLILAALVLQIGGTT
jgi:hypothetical protein